MNLEELDLKDWGTLFQIFLALLTICGVICGALMFWIKLRMQDTFATKGDVAGIETKVTSLSTRIEGVEKGLADLPTHSVVASLRHGLANVQQQMPALAAKVDGQADLLRGIDARLLMVLNKMTPGAGQ